MRDALIRLLDTRAAVAIACGITLALGLFFMFVWAPHPWGWQGIDQYHELARALARGEPFGTTDVPWGYAYYAAFFYRVFGERVWLPLLVQIVLNATTPLLLYRLAAPFVGTRTAVLASLILGVFSFNTVYASTQASDAICTVLFLAAMVVLVRGVRRAAILDFAIGGLLAGLVPQFRPNMVVLPALFAAGYFLIGRTRAHFMRAAVFSVMVTAALAPWIVRNYQLTGTFMPTSTHGGVQLWYGTLQVGPYLESRAYNPRSIFDSPPFPYTSLANTTIVIDVRLLECVPPVANPTVVYWTDRDRSEQRLAASSRDGVRLTFEIPAQPIPTAVYYYLEAGGETGPTLPPGGRANPFVLFVDDRHLDDLDRHQDLLDIFDVIRIARHIAWNEPVDAGGDVNVDGRVDRADLDAAVTILLPESRTPIALDVQDQRVALRFPDGSQMAISKAWQQRQTDLDIEGPLAGALASRWRTRTSLTAGPREGCLAEDLKANAVFYRAEPHMMRRYMALAMDNIRRDPAAFAAASAYRVVRLFIIRGTDDVHTAQQWNAAALAYTAGTVLSAAYLLVFLGGVVVAWRQRSAVLWLLVPIVYVPVTICFVLTNMRYTVTMQPLMFVFVALAVMAAFRLDPPRPGQGRSEHDAE